MIWSLQSKMELKEQFWGLDTQHIQDLQRNLLYWPALLLVCKCQKSLWSFKWPLSVYSRHFLHYRESNCNTVNILVRQSSRAQEAPCFLSQFSSLKWAEDKPQGKKREELNRFTWPYGLTAQVVFLAAALLKTLWGLAQQTLVYSLPSYKMLQEQTPEVLRCLYETRRHW